ncbi:hypothetical protein HHK36_013352 [Tetracentron sinense]|uniref:Uncharacterized protein n=1 Tax=Tetracentron sinense TaxID=13715 RepID=A0A834ZGX4_TETSI|nr:hypothetical protein HHK36_013352 [Tetracentron sinense]
MQTQTPTSWTLDLEWGCKVLNPRLSPATLGSKLLDWKRLDTLEIMVQLFLSEPVCSDDGDDGTAKHRISLLDELGSIIWSLITSGGRSEARLWLCNTIACISSITPRHQRELFMNLLRSKPTKLALAAQLLQMIFEKRPRKAGPILAKKSYMLEKFFKGNPRRIFQWFGNFASGSDSGHKKGSKALSQFAFVNRDICWEELEWKGKHGQSPAMVATKPHYFLDLDIQRTVENFLENVPEFWSSYELAESLKDGEIFINDTKFFVDFFVDLMYEEDSEEVWEVINEFLLEESFSSLCHHLLIILEERDFCAFLELIRKFLNPKMEFKDFSDPSYWFGIILSKCNGCESIDKLLLLNAVINQGRHLLRLVHDEEGQEQKGKIKDIVLQIVTASSIADHWAPFLKECSKEKAVNVIKWLGIQSWVLHYRLSEECETPQSWEALFIKNRISFRKSDNYALLRLDGFSEESGSDMDGRGSVRATRKKKSKSRKKRRRNYDQVGSSNNELGDFDTLSDWRGLQSRAASWLLSTDGYSSSWSSVRFRPFHL